MDKGEIDGKSRSLLGASQSRVKCSLLDGNSIYFTEIGFHVRKKKDFRQSHFLLHLGAHGLTSKRAEQVCALPTVGKAGKTVKGSDSPTPIFFFPASAKRENRSAEINPLRKLRPTYKGLKTQCLVQDREKENQLHS
ncbi:hypothetical protein ACFX2I_022382 [Malus domestica]